MSFPPSSHSVWLKSPTSWLLLLKIHTCGWLYLLDFASPVKLTQTTFLSHSRLSSLFSWQQSNQVNFEREKRPNRARTTEISESFFWIAGSGQKTKHGWLWSYVLSSFWTCVYAPQRLGKHPGSTDVAFFHHNLKTGVPQPCGPSEFSGEHWNNIDSQLSLLDIQIQWP